MGDADRPGQPNESAQEAFWAVQVALSALDRLEVRGRDSAGLHLLVSGHGLDLHSPQIQALLGARTTDPLFMSLAVRAPLGQLSFVYKAAAEIGELGDNTRALRTAICTDPLLHLAVAGPDARVTVLGHTRWASVGVVSQPNAHPLNGEELDDDGRPGLLDGLGALSSYCVAAINGDVDNYAALRTAESLRLAPEVTTDSKVIPTLLSRRLAEAMPLDEAFRTTVARSDGSVAIAVSAAQAPDQLHLALRGSGQALYVGLAEDAFIVASEPYGLVAETADYLRPRGGGRPRPLRGPGGGAGPGPSRDHRRPDPDDLRRRTVAD